MRSRLLFAALVVVALIGAGLAAVLVYRLDDGRRPTRTVGAATGGPQLAARPAMASAWPEPSGLRATAHPAGPGPRAPRSPSIVAARPCQSARERLHPARLSGGRP